MAVRRKKPVKKFKFELTTSAIAGVSVIAYCLFLWMFLLGVWTGQSLLFPTYGVKKVAEKRSTEQSEVLVIKAEKKVIKK